MSEAIRTLQNLPFSNLIGGPLVAAVQAQAQAAETCVEFIDSVGFETAPGGTVRSAKEVTFKYSKIDGGADSQYSLTVPVLAIVPIPYLRIDEVLIDFSVKLNDVVTSTTTSTFGVNISGDASANWGWGRASLRASLSYKNENKSTASSTQDYNMTVRVRAVSADMPGGMQKVLDILEASIREAPSA
jgi:hypothetical protein